MINLSRFKPQIIIAGMLLAVYFIQQVFYIPVSLNASLQLFASQPKDFVAILVEKELYEDAQSHRGLADQYPSLSSMSLRARIQRYAEDVKSKVQAEEIAIMPIPKATSALKIASLLKQAYFGNFQPMAKANLKGVVLIGDLALPVVSEANQNFPSVYPYTDFVQPRVIYEPNQGEFQIDAEVSDPTPEIWHGLISFKQARAMYASYFDKNHLFHSGHADFQSSSTDGFMISEPNFDAKMLNQDLLKSYEKYRQVVGLIVRNKINGKLAQSLMQGMEEITLPGAPEAAGVPVDLSAKAIIDSAAVDLSQVFAKQMAKHQDAAQNLGSYSTSQLISPFSSTFKMEYLAQNYLMQINDMVKEQIQQIVETEQVPLAKVKKASLGGTITFRDGSTQNISTKKFLNHGRPQGFIESLANSIRAITGVGTILAGLEAISPYPAERIVLEAEDLFDEIDGIRETIHESYEDGHIPYVFGRDINTISQASQCPIHFGGGLKNPLDKTIRADRTRKTVQDENGRLLEQCFQSITLDANNKIKPRGFEDGEGHLKKYCSTFSAKAPMHSPSIYDKFELDYPSRLTHESCYAFRTVPTYVNLNKQVLRADLSRANQELDTEDISLGAGLSLATVLNKLEHYPGLDSRDWHAFSSYILANPVQNSFSVRDPLGPDSAIQSVTLRVNKANLNNQKIQSTIFHDFPRPETVKTAILSGAMDLPYDQKSYWTFVDKNGHKQVITLPDPFTAGSFEAYMQELQELEAKFSSISQTNTNYSNSLQNLFLAEESFAQAQDPDSKLTQAKITKAQYLMDFLGLNLNQKFQRIFQDIQDQSFDRSLVLDTPAKIDMAFITGDFQDGQLSFNYPNIFNDVDRQIQDLSAPQADQDPDRDESGCLLGARSDRCLFDLEELESPYFQEYLPKWQDEQTEKISGFLDFITPSFPSFLETHPIIKNPLGKIEFHPADLLMQGRQESIELKALDLNDVAIYAPEGEFTVTVSGPAEITLDPEFQIDTNQYRLQFDNSSFFLPLNFTGSGQVRLTVTNESNQQKKTFSQDLTVYPQLNVSLSQAQISTSASQPQTLEVQVEVLDPDGQALNLPAPSLEVQGDKIVEAQVQNPEKALSHTISVQTHRRGGRANLLIDYQGLQTSLPVNVEFLPATSLKILDQNISALPSDEQYLAKVQALDAYGQPTEVVPEITMTNLNPQKIRLLGQRLTFDKSRAQLRFKVLGQPSGQAYIKFTFNNYENYLKINLDSPLKLLSPSFKSNVLSYNFATDLNLLDQNFTYNLLNNGRTQAMHILTKNLTQSTKALTISPQGAIMNLNPSFQLESSLQDGQLQTRILDSKNFEISKLRADLSQLNFSLQDQDPKLSHISNLHPFTELSQQRILFKQEPVFNLNNKQAHPSLKLQHKVDEQNLVIDLMLGQERVASLNVLDLAPEDFMLQPNYQNSDFKFQVVYQGIDTHQSQVFQFVSSADTAIQPEVLRAENRFNQELTGLNESDKSSFLFAAGSSISESFRPYLADAGLILGDPTIARSPVASQELSKFKFNKTIGEFQARLDAKPSAMVSAGDLIIISDLAGNISVYNSRKQSFQKNLLKTHANILDIQPFKIQNQDRFLILTDAECHIQDACLLVFDPKKPEQKLNTLKLPSKAKPKKIMIGQANADRLDDLFILAEDNSIYLSLGQTNNFQRVVKIGSAKRQIPANGLDLSQHIYFEKNNQAPKIPNPILPITGLNQFQGSFFKYKDANGGYLADQDLISLSIQLNNRTDSRNNFQISIPTYLQPFDLPANITVKNRKINLSLNPNQSRTLRLTARYDFGSDQAPRVFLVQNTQSPVADNLSDVQISLDTDSIIFYNSNLNRNRISYQRQILNSPAPNLEAEPEEAPVLGQLESLLKAESEEDKKEAAHQSLLLMANSDGDGDGFPDMYDSATNKLSNTAKSIEKAIKKYQCSGGCLAIPVNQSFLTPLTPADPGFPILGISLVTPWVTSGPSAALMPLHFYLSPTLTGELYTAVCAGVYPASWCLPFKVADLGNLCKKINQKLMKLMSKGVDIAASKINEYSGSVISLGASETNLPRPNTGIIGFPELFTDWLANQYAELVRFIDLPDITLVYPRVETLFTRVPSSKTEEQFRKSAGVNEETANVFSLCPRFQPYTDLCGNVGTPAEFEAMKKENNIHYNLQNYAKSLEQEFSDLPILNIRPVPTKISYPMVSQSELYRFLGTALKTRDKLIISFLNALDDWRCMESDRQHQSDIMYQKLVQGDASAYKQKVSTEYKNTVSENPDAPKPTFVDTKFLKDDESFFEFLFDALISGRMATFMAAKQDPSKVKGKACIDLAIGFEGILGNLDKNMRIIQSYRDIPLHIFEIQNFLAVYAGNILDYGITILEGVNGWLVRQVDALGKWLAMVEDLLKLLDSFKLIMNLFVDFQNSCDTCRSDRTNLGLNMIINLVFQAVPDIPVIRLPKLPNLTLDVSELVAGFTVDLPELKFDPNYLKLPDIDLSIELPKAPPIGLRAQLKGFEMPLLPEVPDFKVLIDFPEIPPLEFPRLPDLPDPPEVGKIGFEFEAKFGAAIDFLTQALRLYCLYLKGITGVPGPLLKTQIETMSNRPLSPVLPIDKLFAIQMPSLTGEYLAEHQYILTSDLRYGFPQVAELTKAFTDQLDEFSIEIKNYFQDFLDSLSKFTTIKIEAFKSLEELDLQKDITVDPEKEVQPGLQSYHIQVLPQATQAKTLRHDLDIASLEKRLQQLPYSLSKQLAPVYLAATGQSYEFQPAPGNLVADTSTQPKPPAALESRTIQLAALADGPIDPRENADFVTPNRGIKIQNDLNQVQDVMNYNLNDIQGSRVTLHDVDQDRDPDLMFNLEQDIFIKRNQDKAHNSRQTASIQEVQFDSFQDSIPSSLSLEKQSLSFTDSVGQTQISLSENLQDQILILDVYEADFSSPKAYMRYVINPLEDISKPQVLQSYQFGQEIQIAKQQFQNIVLLPPGSGQLSLSLLNNPYLVLPSYYNLASQSLEVLDTYQAINPSECYDRVPPSIQVNQNELGKLGLYQRATIDLSQSQDLETEIVKLYLDTDPEVDSDLDSNPQNDVNLIGSQNPTASKFRIGPFNSEHESRYIIHAVDKVGNRAQKQVNISVAIPEIKLESASASQVQGQVTPKFEDAPIEIIRKRNGQNQIIGNLTTDEQGRFTLNTPNPGVGLAQTLSIIDSQQQEHFRINKQTGTVMAMTPQARIQVQPAQPDQHTEIQLYHGQNRLSTLQRIGITEQDVQLLNQSPSQQELAQLQATSVWDLQPKDQIQAEILAPSNESFYGGLAIKEGENILATVDKDGAIQLKSNALSLKLEEVAHIDQAQSYEIYHKQTLIFKAFVPTSDSELALKQDSFTVRQLIPEPTEAASAPEPSPAPAQTSAPSPAPEQLLDLEETNPNYEAITYLLEQGVFSGVQTERGLEFQSERLINRAEYAKVILKILCIEPSKPAYLPPAVFSDIPHTNQDLIWYYPITKESFLQNFFEGYLGEKDPQTQLSPFKPANNITRIEAAKVIMEALNTQGSIDISEIPYLTPWYKAFLAASQDLRSYLTEPDGQSKKLFLITEAEAQLAEKFLTRGEFAQMAYRALQIHNCLAKQPQDEQESPEISDSQTTNQLSNQEKSPQEPSQTPSPPAAEASQDQVGDQAGAKEPYQPPKPAINLEEVSCNSCPCRYTIKDNQSLSAKDEVFAILRNQDRSQVLNISNSLQLEKDS